MIPHQAFHRKLGKERLPAAEDQALPQPGHEAIAVGKGVDKGELIMENCRGNQRVDLSGLADFRHPHKPQ